MTTLIPTKNGMSRTQRRIELYKDARRMVSADHRPKLLHAIINQLFAQGLPQGWGQ